MKPSISWRKQKAQRRLVAESRGKRVALARARRFREEPVPKRRLTLRVEVLVDHSDFGSAQLSEIRGGWCGLAHLPVVADDREGVHIGLLPAGDGPGVVDEQLAGAGGRPRVHHQIDQRVTCVGWGRGKKLLTTIACDERTDCGLVAVPVPVESVASTLKV
jgi:hypothetical protein